MENHTNTSTESNLPYPNSGNIIENQGYTIMKWLARGDV